ncbi:MAG: hypothetical protein ABFE13_22175 [Phycisphaerales bacterium]
MGHPKDEKIECWNRFCKEDAELQGKLDDLLSRRSIKKCGPDIEAIVSARRESLLLLVQRMVVLSPLEDVVWYLEQSANVVALFERQLKDMEWSVSPKIGSPYAMALSMMNEEMTKRDDANSALRNQNEKLNDALGTIKREDDELRGRMLRIEEERNALLRRFPVRPFEEDGSADIRDIVSECRRIQRINPAARYEEAAAAANHFYEKFRPLCDNENLIRDTIRAIQGTADFALRGDDQCRILSTEPALYSSEKVVSSTHNPPSVSTPCFIKEVEVGCQNNVSPGPIGKRLLQDAPG